MKKQPILYALLITLIFCAPIIAREFYTFPQVSEVEDRDLYLLRRPANGIQDNNTGTRNISGAALKAAFDNGSTAARTARHEAETTAAHGGIVAATDPRLSDARTPTEHNQAAATITGLATVATSGSYNDLANKPIFTRGYDGREVEVRNSGSHIQWRYIADPPAEWINLVALADITGTNGAAGKTYSLAITGGIRSLLYDLNGSNPAPTMAAFGAELREDGAIVTPATYAWGVPASGSLLSGSSTTSTFTPTVAGTFTVSSDNRVDLTVTYAGLTISATAPIPITKVGATGADGSPDTKQQIYTKIGAAATGDVLRTQCGPGDAAGFAAREIRDPSGNIILTYTCGGQITVYNLPGDAASTIKLLVKKTDGSNGLVYKAGGTLELY